MKKKNIEILKILSNIYKNPKSELNFNNPFELLCAVILSAQATDVSVNKVTPELFKRAKDAHAMALMSEEEIGEYIKSIGLWRAKASYLLKTSQKLVELYDGVVPNEYEKLIKLPGVGSKTAKVVLNVAFSQPTIAVDTHIFRVCNRTGFCIGKTAKEVEDKIVKEVPDEYKLNAHHYLLLHGRYVCKARDPNCENCPITAFCNSYKKI